ncbi:MAG: O-antigen ligase family protein [Limisphaerales bacterium]
METKDLIGLTLVIIAIIGSVGVACLSSRVRSVAFFLLITTAMVPYRLDINFVSRYLYRGTTRGFEVTFADIMAISVLASTMLLPRRTQAGRFWPASLGWMILYFLWACFSVSVSEPKLYGLFELSKILRGLLVFLAAAWFVRSERELRVLVLALACAVCFEGLEAVKQRVLQGIFRVTGSIDHPNSLSMYLCMTAPVLVAAAASEFPRYLRWLAQVAIAAATLSIVLTISRAGIPMFGLVVLGAAVACVSLRFTVRKAVAALVIGLAVAGLFAKSWIYMKARYSEATLEEEYLDPETQGRGLYLRLARAIVEERFLGIGLNNWSYWVSKRYGPRQGVPYEDYDDLEYAPSRDIAPSFVYAAPAHNLEALTVGELGVPGLVLFLLIWWRWLRMGASFLGKRVPDPMHRLGVGLFFSVCGILLQSQTEWVYRQTPIFLSVHVLVGTLASLYHHKQASEQPADCRVAAPAEGFVGPDAAAVYPSTQ